MEPDYYKHLMLLIDSIWIVLFTFSLEELETTKRNLDEWYQQIPSLYIDRFCKINEHLVGKHLWKTCQDFGPLSTHSCFAFESFYGDLIKLKSGTIPYQKTMLFTTGYQQTLTQLAVKSKLTNDTWQGHILEKLEVPIQLIQNKYVYLIRIDILS